MSRKAVNRTELYKEIRGNNDIFYIFDRRTDELMTSGAVKAEVERLDKAIDLMEFPVILCHNDLKTTNILYNDVTGNTCLPSITMYSSAV